jgi:hypothetical protein
MLIGIQLSDLSRRTRWLLVLATVAFVAGLAVWWLAPEPPVRLIRVWLGAIVALGIYWLSFLVDFRGRLGRGQTIVATLFALLPWILVIAIVVGFPQILLAGSGRA